MKKSTLVFIAFVILLVTSFINNIDRDFKLNSNLKIQLFEGRSLSNQLLKEFQKNNRDDFYLIKNMTDYLNMQLGKDGTIKFSTWELGVRKGETDEFVTFQGGSGPEGFRFTETTHPKQRIMGYKIPLFDLMVTFEDISWEKIFNILPNIGSEDFYQLNTDYYFNHDIKCQLKDRKPNILNEYNTEYQFSLRPFIYYLDRNGTLRKIKDNDLISIRKNTVLLNIVPMKKETKISHTSVPQQVSLFIEMKTY